MSSAINKVKDALHLNKDKETTHTTSTTHTTGTHTTGTAEGVAGPHSSRVANAADPRVDSDLDGSNRHTGAHTHGAGTGLAGTHNANTYPNSGAGGVTGGYTGAGTGIHGGTGTTHTSNTTAGPHSSNLANKIDPRVDSDRSDVLGGSTHTGTGYGSTGTGVGHSTHTGAGLGSTGTGAGHTGTVGGISHSTNAGPHNSAMANKADPRVDSDNSRGHTTGNGHSGILGASGSHATPGSGTAQNTAGPHNSDMLNKVDPRVDSDLSGGKTYGGNQTHA